LFYIRCCSTTLPLLHFWLMIHTGTVRLFFALFIHSLRLFLVFVRFLFLIYVFVILRSLFFRFLRCCIVIPHFPDLLHLRSITELPVTFAITVHYILRWPRFLPVFGIYDCTFDFLLLYIRSFITFTIPSFLPIYLFCSFCSCLWLPLLFSTFISTYHTWLLHYLYFTCIVLHYLLLRYGAYGLEFDCSLLRLLFSDCAVSLFIVMPRTDHVPLYFWEVVRLYCRYSLITICYLWSFWWNGRRWLLPFNLFWLRYCWVMGTLSIWWCMWAFRYFIYPRCYCCLLAVPRYDAFVFELGPFCVVLILPVDCSFVGYLMEVLLEVNSSGTIIYRILRFDTDSLLLWPPFVTDYGIGIVVLYHYLHYIRYDHWPSVVVVLHCNYHLLTWYSGLFVIGIVLLSYCYFVLRCYPLFFVEASVHLPDVTDYADCDTVIDLFGICYSIVVEPVVGIAHYNYVPPRFGTLLLPWWFSRWWWATVDTIVVLREDVELMQLMPCLYLILLRFVAVIYPLFVLHCPGGVHLIVDMLIPIAVLITIRWLPQLTAGLYRDLFVTLFGEFITGLLLPITYHCSWLLFLWDRYLLLLRLPRLPFYRYSVTSHYLFVVVAICAITITLWGNIVDFVIHWVESLPSVVPHCRYLVLPVFRALLTTCYLGGCWLWLHSPHCHCRWWILTV